MAYRKNDLRNERDVHDVKVVMFVKLTEKMLTNMSAIDVV